MKRWLFLGITLLVLPALAQEQRGAAESPEVIYKKETVLDFEGDVVKGTFVRPEVDLVNAHKKTGHVSLIEVRANFLPEMLKSGETPSTP